MAKSVFVDILAHATLIPYLRLMMNDGSKVSDCSTTCAFCYTLVLLSAEDICEEISNGVMKRTN